LVYQKRDLVCQVVEAVQQQTLRPARIIVVDNGSSDGSGAAVAARFPDVEVIVLPHNDGVGAGHNAGWRVALADPTCAYLWVLEHDCIPEPDCLAQLLQVQGRWVPLGEGRLPRVVFPAQLTPLHHTGRLTFVLVGFHLRRIYTMPRTYPPLAASFFTFNGLLLPVAVVRALGLLDESYFLGAEDSDLSARCRRARIAMLQVPAARVEHDHYREIITYRVGPWLLGLPLRIDPGRIYYAHRNAILHLLRYTDHPRELSVRMTIYLLALVVRDLFLPQGRLRVWARLTALRDGFTGQTGRKAYGFMTPRQTRQAP
jgi:glycosyltransferase involved in cell wall biosynthesis